MTREEAVAAARALNDIEGFEGFIESVNAAVNDFSDLCYFTPEFRLALTTLLEDELARMNTVLENM